MVSRASIEEISAIIAREFVPERIILFGSHAYGVPNADSDVDLLVVMPHEGDSVEKEIEIRRRVRPPFAMDVLVSDPHELRRRVALGDFFLKDITEKGRVLYESPDP